MNKYIYIYIYTYTLYIYTLYIQHINTTKRHMLAIQPTRLIYNSGDTDLGNPVELR